MFLMPTGNTASVTPVAISNVDSPVNTGTATAYTFSSATLGTGKIVVIAEGSDESPNVTGITIDGAAATEITSEDNSGNMDVAMFYVDGNTSSSGDVVVTFSGNVTSCGLGVWLVTDAAAGGASDSQTAAADSGTTALAVTMNVPANGGCIGGTGHNNSGSTNTWVGIDENYDEVVDGGAHDTGHTGASKIFTAADTSLDVTVTPSATSKRRLVCASFAPA